jgi:PKD repeat protein
LRKIIVYLILICFIGNSTNVLSQQIPTYSPPDNTEFTFSIDALNSTTLTVNITINFSLNNFLFNTFKGYDRIQSDQEEYTVDLGKPFLPIKNIRVALPTDMKISAIHIQHITEQILNGTYTIFPTQKPLPTEIAFTDATFIKPDVQTYTSHQAYPSKKIELIGQSDLAGQVMADFTIYPFHYTPAEKKLTLITSITFSILGTTGYSCGDYLSPRLSTNKQNSLLQLCQNLVVNPETVHLRVSPIPQPAGVSPGDYDYVIITQNSWVSAFQPLADWKTKKGVPATIVTTSWIYNNGSYNGSNVEKIRQFAQDVYTNWGTTYILLGGDVDVVPCHYRTFSTVDPIPIPNDAYYADFDSDWVCEINIGRASVTGPGTGTGQIGNFVNKIITYETNPPLTNYTKNAAFFGFDLDAQTQGEQCKIDINSTYIPSNWTMTTVYDSQEGNPKTNVITALNAGQNLVNHIDHCDSGFMGTGYLNDYLGLSNSDMDALTNGNKQSILYSQGCHPVQYNISNCIAEHFVRDTNGGGIAFIGYSGYGYYAPGSYSTYSMRYDVFFFRSLFQKNLYHLGGAFSDHKNDGVQGQLTNEYYKYMFTGLTLLGDPELPIWTENPITFNVTHPNQLVRNSASFKITVKSNGLPVNQAYVCLWKKNEVYLTGFTNASGGITFHPSPTTVGTMYVTVTKHNYRPYQGLTTVVNQLPVANFTYTPLNPTTANLIHFNDTSTDSDGTIISWTWKFGDGITATSRNPQHQYTDDGTYLISLNITDNDGGKKETSKSISVSNVPPIVNFTYSPINPSTSDTIHFNDTSTDNDGMIITWYWKFGDGTFSTLRNPNHRFSDDGVYSITLNVTDDDGAIQSKSKSLSVRNIPPHANFTYQPSNPRTTDSIYFTDTSFDLDGFILSWFWNFGDGSTSTQQNPVHKYLENGNYTVVLNVTDDDGAKNALAQSLFIRNVPPIANFTFTPINPMAYETVFFNSTSSDLDGMIVNYTWDFGDGNDSYQQKSTHIYTENGTYLILLNITDDDGDTNSIQKIIIVSPNNPPNTPSNPFPSNNSNTIPLNVILQWTGGDPNYDTVTYDIYFGLTNPPEKVKNNQTSTEYNSGELNFTTPYYWRIVAWDTHGLNTTSPTWNFITRTNHVPQVTPDSYSLSEDSVLSVSAPGVLGNDIDSDGDTMTVIKVSDVLHGSLTVNNNGSFRYVPFTNYYGTDTFTYKVSDGFAYSLVETVTITVTPINDPPVFGSASPGNNSVVNLIRLTWSIPINDIEGDSISWTIECSNGQNISGNNANNGTESLLLSGLVYSTIYKIWVNATDPMGSKQFTRRWYILKPKSSPGGGGGGGGNGKDSSSEPLNQNPVANASAGEPYQGFINTPILFNGSNSYDPDGNITIWHWIFSDNSNETGEIVNHTFSKIGTYNVTLLVTDNHGASDSDFTTCEVLQPNRPPSKPLISGPLNGTTNTTYTFSVLSTDEDNDSIRYSIIWGDETSYANMSDFLPNGTEFTFNHRWRLPGQYAITVTASDNHTMSSSQKVITITELEKKAPETKTPGFDLIFIMYAIAITLFLRKRKQKL